MLERSFWMKEFLLVFGCGGALIVVGMICIHIATEKTWRNMKASARKEAEDIVGAEFSHFLQKNTMDMAQSHLDELWYVVDQPWGDGSWVIAGNPDPHIGKFVCCCEDISLIDFTDNYTDEDAKNDCRNRAYHIAEIHNQSLKQTETSMSAESE
jgi:hypothetical protein